MSRPCYALSLLLVIFAGSMMLVQAAHGQSALDARLGYTRHQLCPLLGDHIISCGYGPLATPLGLAEARRGCAISETLGPWSHGRFACTLGTASEEAAISNSKIPAEQLLSGHDAVYDAAVYGVEPQAAETKAATQPAPVLGTVFYLPDPLPPAHTVVMQHVRELLTYGPIDACWPVPPLARVSLPAREYSASNLDAEPESIAEYYAMYGGAEIAIPVAEAHSISAQDAAAGLRAVMHLPTKIADSFWNSPSIAMKRCELHDVQYRLQAKWSDAIESWSLKGNYAQSIAPAQPAVADLAAPLAAPAIPSDEMHADAERIGDASRHLGRFVLKSLARSLDHTADVLQNASRGLNNLLENQTSPVSVEAGLTD